jgi:hypothetical protein
MLRAREALIPMPQRVQAPQILSLAFKKENALAIVRFKNNIDHSFS